MELEFKTVSLTDLEFKDSEASVNGEFSGYTSVFGSVDSYGDTVVPGAYRETIPQFLKRGFVSWSHEWRNPIGMIVEAYEDTRGLFVRGVFHSNPEAQSFRRIAQERLGIGKFMGLSIGYKVLGSEMRKSPKPYRNIWGEMVDEIRALTKLHLFESALVMVPAEESSGVSLIKSWAVTPDYVPSYEEASGHVIVVNQEFILRTRETVVAAKAGRAISAARRKRMSAVSEALKVSAQEIDDMLVETAPSSDDVPDEEDEDETGDEEGGDQETGKGASNAGGLDDATSEALEQWKRLQEINDRFNLPTTEGVS